MSIFAKPEVVVQRLKLCTPCEFKNTSFLVPICDKCKCIIAAKVRIADQKCPIDKW